MPKLSGDDTVGDADATSRKGRDTEHISGSSIRQVLKWSAFARGAAAFGFDILTNAQLPEMSQKRTGISVCFEKITGWKVPKNLMTDVNLGYCDLSIHLTLSLFHMKSLTFFGTNWRGTAITFAEGKVPDVIDINYTDIIYILSRLIDPSCIGVVEIVVTRIDTDTKLATAQYGCGWAMLSLFGQHSLHDAADGYFDVSTTNATFYKGSPRDILGLSFNDISTAGSLHEISGCTLQFKMYSFRKLLKISDLIIENAIIGRYDVVAGLKEKEITLPDQTRPQMLSCIGDLEVHDEKQGVFYVPGSPTVASTYAVKLSNFQLFVPNRTSVESKLRLKVGSALPDSSKAIIISRSIKLGMHNGRTAIAGQYQEYVLEDDPEDSDVLTISSAISIGGYCPNEVMALVMVVEYTIGMPSAREAQHSFKLIKESASKHDENVISINVGSAVYVPYDGHVIKLREAFVDSDDSAFDIELELRTDDICRLLSPHKVFNLDSDADEAPKIGFDINMYDPADREIFDGHEVDAATFAEDAPEDITSVDSGEPPSRRSQFSRKPSKFVSPESDSVAELRDEMTMPSSSMKLDQTYYTSTMESPDKPSRTKSAHALSDTSSDLDFRNIPKSSLLSRSLRLSLTKNRDPRRADDFLMENKQQSYETKHVYSSDQGNVREISRGARARLSRHGFNAGHDDAKSALSGHVHSRTLENVNLDIDLEARDVLSLHDISIQFAGYRSGSVSVKSADSARHSKPRSIYCSYQFFTCNHTRTETMRIFPSGNGDVGVLVREEAHSRNEPPLALRHSVDCSEVSPREAFDFAEYLGHRMLYVDVWDADSLLMIGSCAIPLRRLMRQGQSIVKCAIECDVVNCDSATQITGGVTSMSIMPNGPLIGSIVGSMNIILSNTGRTGRGKYDSADSKDDSNSEINWRLKRGDEAIREHSHVRPKNSVRAKPLAECEPKLSKVLTDHRLNMGSNNAMRSLSDIRANENQYTITYDELVRLFKRFQGTLKGSIQYRGPLMNLMEVSSQEIANGKFMKALKRLKQSGIALKLEISKFSGSDGVMTTASIKELVHKVSSVTGVTLKIAEVSVLVGKYCEHAVGIQSSKLLRLIEEEIVTYEWMQVAKRFKSSFQQATLSGIDFEQIFSEYDRKADGFLSPDDFKTVLQALNPYVSFTPLEITAIANYFTQRGDDKENSPNAISIRAVMAYIGKEYIGNIRSRLVGFLLKGSENAFGNKLTSSMIRKGKNPSHDPVVVDDIEDAFNDFGVYKEFTHTQVRPLIMKIIETVVHLTAANFLRELGVTDHGPKASLNAESLLKVIIGKVTSKGVDIEATFRHFDSDGSGTLTREELEEGMSRLEIFDSVPNWRSQISEVVNKFDSSKDGSISIKEFLDYVGIKEYAPNIIQKMTKIFARSLEKGLSIQDIFAELDSKSDGFVTAHELHESLKKFGTFGDVSLEDAIDVVAKLDENKSGKISAAAFVEFFGPRIKQVNADKARKKTEKLIQRFRNLMKASIEKGLNPEDIFKHFDKDGGGSLDVEEFSGAIRSLPHFSTFKQEDLTGLVEVIDSDGSGVVSLDEFKKFVLKTVPSKKAELKASSPRNDEFVARIKERFEKAEKHGTSVEAIFLYLDTNRNGRLSASEFEQGLKRLPHFDNIRSDDLKSLVTALDVNMDGDISLREFRKFMYPEEASISSVADKRNLFCRLLRRIAEPDGGVAGLIAYLDKEAKGLISADSLYRLLSRENVYETVTKAECEDLLKPITIEGSINSALLLRLTEDDKFDPRASLVKSAISKSEETKELDEVGYDFSKNPEIRATEKKLRNVGRVLAKNGTDIEGLFKKFDSRHCGMIARSDFIDILSRSGLYLLEKGDILEATKDAADVSSLQRQQIQRLKGVGPLKAGKDARKFVVHDSKSNVEFQDHLESMALINWYRQGQKQMMLQRVLSHSLSTSINIYPSFGKTIFFEMPIRNPFDHEEFFMVEIQDPELRLVTNFGEWLQLRESLRASSPSIGEDPVDPDMFDQDGKGNIHFALLPHETIHLPYSFLTLIPTVVTSSSKLKLSSGDEKKLSGENHSMPVRTAEVRIISGTHGHVVSVLKVCVFPRPFSVNRTLRFMEVENLTFKSRINLLASRSQINCSRYIHSVEIGNENRVVVEYDNQGITSEATEIMFRYRCPQFPIPGSFYVLIYADPFHCELVELWYVIVQSRLKLDVHTTIGSNSSSDLVVRGDSFGRRVQAFSSSPSIVSFSPSSVMQMSAGVFNRISVNVSPVSVGTTRVMINLVDVDSTELVSSWILTATSSSPIVVRQYDVVLSESSTQKKITFKNPWDIPRRFSLSSSDELLMKPRDALVDVGSQGTCILRLWFAKSAKASGNVSHVFLFLNDVISQGEECFQFNLLSA